MFYLFFFLDFIYLFLEHMRVSENVGQLKCKGELRRKMNLWSNNTLVPTVVDRSLRFVFMIIECKDFYL